MGGLLEPQTLKTMVAYNSIQYVIIVYISFSLFFDLVNFLKLKLAFVQENISNIIILT